MHSAPRFWILYLLNIDRSTIFWRKICSTIKSKSKISFYVNVIIFRVNRLSDKDFIQKFAKYIEPSDLNLRDIVFNADSRVPITLLLTAQSTYVVRNIYIFAEQLPRDPPINLLDPMHNQNRIQLVPLDNIGTFDWKYALEDDQWLIIQNCQLLTNDQLVQLESLIDQVNA